MIRSFKCKDTQALFNDRPVRRFQGINIMKRRRDLERDIRSAEDDLQLEQLRLLQPIQKNVAKVVEELGKEKGFTMIVDKSARGLLYTDKSLNITELVVQKLNEHGK